MAKGLTAQVKIYKEIIRAVGFCSQRNEASYGKGDPQPEDDRGWGSHSGGSVRWEGQPGPSVASEGTDQTDTD